MEGSSRESLTTIGIGEFSIKIPTVTKKPTLTIISVSSDEKTLSETLARIVCDIIVNVEECTHYIRKLREDLWGSLLIVTLRNNVGIDTIMEKLKRKISSIKGLECKITPYIKVFKRLYIIRSKPAIMLLNEHAYILPDSYISANLRTLIETLGKGSGPVIRRFGQKIGEGIAQSLRRMLTKEDLNVERKSLLKSLVLYASYTDQLPYCLEPEIQDNSIKIRIRDDIRDEDLKNGVRYLNYGIIEKLIEEFGFKSIIRRAEMLELIIDVEGSEYAIRIE